MRTSETIENVKSYHTSSYEVGKIAKEVKAKTADGSDKSGKSPISGK